MYKFITIRCRSCGSVIYNLPENEIKKFKLVNLTCEDCMEHRALEEPQMEKSSTGNSKHKEEKTQIKFVS
jgi:hypothetical protein